MQKTGFQMLNDDEIVTSVQESDPDGEETAEDEENNNESSKGPSNADALFALEKAMDRPCPVQWLVTLIAVPLGLDLKPRESMEVCKCMVLSLHGGTLNSHRAANPPMRLVKSPLPKLEWNRTKLLSHLNGTQSYGNQQPFM
ncbi:hypothetical protein TNCV_4643361 [Trichonephila clavipes]|nr:hypothetical protein TNCV_4643361 [Trichonephila clavipes]